MKSITLMASIFALMSGIFFTTNIFTAKTSTGIISGKVTDFQTGDPIPFAKIELINAAKTIDKVTSDMEGAFQFSVIDEGMYSAKVSIIGYKMEIQKNIKVNPDETTKITFQLHPNTSELHAIEIVDEEIEDSMVPTLREVKFSKKRFP